MSKTNHITNYEYLTTLLGDDYDGRIPELTRTNITEVGNAVVNYSPARNAFCNDLINKIGLTMVAKLEDFTNPFARFRGIDINYGDTIEDIAIDLVDGYAFNGEDTNPFAIKKGNIGVCYHTIDRQLQYCVTISDKQLKTAFKNQYGLDELVNGLVDSLYTSKEFDNYVMTKELLANPYNYGEVVYMGFTSEDTDAQKAKKLTTALKDYASKLSFVSNEHNAMSFKQATPKQKQLLVIPYSQKNNIDIEYLSGVYNLDKVDLTGNIIEIDDFNNHNILCSLIDERGLRIHNALENAEDQRNAKAQYTNYFVNNWGLQSISLYRNSVLFLAGAEPEIAVTITTKKADGTAIVLTGVAVKDKDGNTITATSGTTYNLKSGTYTIEGDNSSDNYEGEFTITGKQILDDTAININVAVEVV